VYRWMVVNDALAHLKTHLDVDRNGGKIVCLRKCVAFCCDNVVDLELEGVESTRSRMEGVCCLLVLCGE